MGNVIITNRAPAPEVDDAKVNDGVRMSLRTDGGDRIDRSTVDIYLGYGPVRWNGGYLPETDEERTFIFDRLFGNPAAPPDHEATRSIELDDSLKLEKYLASDYQKGMYFFGGLEAPAASDAKIMAEFVLKMNSADISPDGNNFTGVLFGFFIGDGGLMVKFFDNGGGTRWIEVFDADQNSTQRVDHPSATYIANYDWSTIESTYKILWDPQEDVMMLLLSSGDPLTTDQILITGSVSDFPTIPADQIRDNQPIAFFGHGYSDPTSISYWKKAAFYNLTTLGVLGGVYQGEHEGLLKTDNITSYLPEATPGRSDVPWILLPDSFDDIDGQENILEQRLLMERSNTLASFGYYRHEPVVADLPVVLDFKMSGSVWDQESGLQASGMEVYVDDGTYACRIGFLFDLLTRSVGILGQLDPKLLGSYAGSEVDWTEELMYRVVYDPGGPSKLYLVTDEGEDVVGLAYLFISSRTLAELPASSMPGPGVGFIHNGTLGEAKAIMNLSYLRYFTGARIYFGSDLPASPWSQSGTGTAEVVSGSELQMESTSDSDQLRYTRTETSHDLSSVIGITVDCRVAVDEYIVGTETNPLRENTGVGVIVDDGTHSLILTFAEAGPEIGKIVYIATGDLDSTLFKIRSGRSDVEDIWSQIDWSYPRTYRLEKTLGGRLRLYIDESVDPVIDFDVNQFSYPDTDGSGQWISFGCLLDSHKNTSRWEFLHYGLSAGYDVKIDQVREEDDRFDLASNLIVTCEDV